MNVMRQQTLTHLRQNPNLSILILGGGINGIGTFRDLAQQGVDVLLIDKNDFCAGASAASSHMVHGGIRYLENGEFRLVREAVQERNRLIENAPHLVHPLPTVIPIFRWFSGLLNAPLKFLRLLDRPAERGAIVIKLGLLMYDAYTRQQGTVPRHQFTPRAASLTRFPALNPDILFTARYFDGTMPMPERIAVELILDAETSNPRARALNYLALAGSHGPTLILRDQLTGEEIPVTPQIVVNAAGPWIDLTNQHLNLQTRFIGGTKGSHLILDHPQLRQAIGDNEFFFENKDGRITLIYPLFDKVMIGTSDIPLEDPEQATCTEEEVDYFLNMIPVVFPTLRADRSHIVYRFSGVRPLPAMDAATAGQISRDHSIRPLEPDATHPYPILNLIGGKWTTFRAFAEQATDQILARLGLPRQTDTRHTPIGGAKDYPTDQQAWLTQTATETGLPLARLQTLFTRYGTRAAQIARLPEAATPLQTHPAYTLGEITYLLTHEKVIHLDDLLLRRTSLGKLGEITPARLAEIATLTAQTLNWPEPQKQEEIARVTHLLATRHGVNL